MGAPLLLGLDPSLRATGWAVAELRPRGDLEVIAAGCWRTASEAKRRGLLIPADDARCLQLIAAGLADVLEQHGPIRLAAMEAPAGSRSARAAHTLGLARGVLVGALLREGLALDHVLAGDAKAALVGKRTASKPAMVEAAAERWPAVSWPDGSQAEAEAAADAAGVALVAAGGAFAQALAALA